MQKLERKRMEWPGKLDAIIEMYYSMQTRSGNQLTPSERTSLVERLIAVFDSLNRTERTDVLIPANGNYLKDRAIFKDVFLDGTVEYSFRYNWPANPFAGTVSFPVLTEGEQYDRIGGREGRYLSPLKEDGTPESYLARAIPYYIPEACIRDCPSYHCYTVKQRYEGETGKPVKKGTIAQAFQTRPADGGGVQIQLPVPISRLKEVF